MPSRPVGMGIGALPTQDILAIAPWSGLDEEDFLSLCRQLDTVYIEHASRRTT